MQVTVYKVSSPSDEDLETAINIVDVAFAKDDIRRLFTGGDPALTRPHARAMATAPFVGGEVYFAREVLNGEGEAQEQGKVVGMAAWYPPGRAAYDSEEAKTQVMEPFLATLPQDIRDWQTNLFRPGYQRLTDKYFGPGYKLGSYHLQVIAVLPGYQGKGISRQLIEHVKDKIAHPQGIPACLEATTQRNVDIYSRIGFKQVGQGTFDGAARVGGQLTLYCMTCEAQGTG